MSLCQNVCWSICKQEKHNRGSHSLPKFLHSLDLYSKCMLFISFHFYSIHLLIMKSRGSNKHCGNGYAFKWHLLIEFVAFHTVCFNNLGNIYLFICISDKEVNINEWSSHVLSLYLNCLKLYDKWNTLQMTVFEWEKRSALINFNEKQIWNSKRLCVVKV